MDDQTLDTLQGVTEGTIVSEDGNGITEVNQGMRSAEDWSSPLLQNINELSNQLESLKIGGNTVSKDEHNVTEETCCDEDQTRPVLQKFEEVCSEVQSSNTGGNTDSMDESNVTEETDEACSDEEQTLPVLQKFEKLSSKVQSLKKEHALLCSEVKDITSGSFPSEVFSALQGLSTEHEHLKKKYSEECELLKNKYIEECSERKRLYNEVIELKGNIRVFCRCRPLNQDEVANATSSIVDFETGQENEFQIISADSSKKQFKFDHVFKPDDNQEAVFVETSPIVTSVLDGYNVCIFAYGQTGTGKTFTMEGTTENRGVNYRTLEELFRISDERRSVMQYELSVSMLEVYNEKIRDLLVENSNQPSKKLDIKQAADGTQEVPGLIEASVHSTDEVWEILKSGSRARSVGSTNANELSSRSHCLLRVTVKAESLINGQKTKSHLWLVDLAGSERVGRIEVEGERLKESQFINRSLSALGDVISALASKSAHIPYRNSKLTHMLQSSLGGDCKTVMFVQISPSATDLGETLCSLNFASRVRGIEHGPARKHTDTTELFKYKQLAEKAKHDEKEMKRLQDTLQSVQLRLAAREQISRSLQEKVRDLENQLAEERKTRLKQETKALAAVSSQPSASSSLSRPQTTVAETKPPLGPSKLRMPLRRITNFMPSPSPLSSNLKTRPPPPTLSNSTDDKENTMRTTASAAKAKTVLRARRGSFAVRPTPSAAAATQTNQPKRRASIATFRPEPPVAATPLNSGIRPRTERVVGRQSFVWDPQRVWRTSRVYSPPLPQVKEGSSRAVEAATPVAPPKSRRFMGSPPTVAGSWKPKHPTVVALQRKQIVWSPLKLKSMKAGSSRRSLQPY